MNVWQWGEIRENDRLNKHECTKDQERTAGQAA